MELEKLTGLGHWRAREPWRIAEGDEVGYHADIVHGQSGLEWTCQIGWESGSRWGELYHPKVTCRNRKAFTLPEIQVLGRNFGSRTIPPSLKEWGLPVAKGVAEFILEAKNAWEHVVAATFEGLIPSIREEIIPLSRYDRSKHPLGFTTRHASKRANSTLVYRHRVQIAPNGDSHHIEYTPDQTIDRTHAWPGTGPELIKSTWAFYETIMDPPGYAWKAEGEQRETILWSWRWAGQDVNQSSCPKPRKFARMDAWADFWSEKRNGE